MNAAQAINARPDKTGSLGQIVGTPGRKSATWTMQTSMAGSGAAGTKPEIDEFLEAAFGAAATASAGVSVTYNLANAAPSLTIFDFNRPATVSQRAIMGAIVSRMKADIGQDFAALEFSGEGKWAIDTDQFSTADTTAKSGLTTFPTEPTTPTSVGSAVAGYKGTITLDGQTYTTFRTGSIELAVARELPKDGWSSDYPIAPANGLRTVRLDFSLYDDDSANLQAFKGKAFSNTPVNITLAIGTSAGNIWTWNLKNVLVAKPAYDYSQTRRGVNFNGCTAHMSSITQDDELQLVLT